MKYPEKLVYRTQKYHILSIDSIVNIISIMIENKTVFNQSFGNYITL